MFFYFCSSLSRPTQEENNGTWLNYFNKAVQSAANYLPTQASDVLTQDRAFATVHVPLSALNYKNICALAYIQRNLRLLLTSADGYFYMFDVNTQEGGNCKLLTQASIYTPTQIQFTNSNLSKDNNNEQLNNNTDPTTTTTQSPPLQSTATTTAASIANQNLQQLHLYQQQELHNQQQQQQKQDNYNDQLE
jgi:hypothetical protein